MSDILQNGQVLLLFLIVLNELYQPVVFENFLEVPVVETS